MAKRKKSTAIAPRSGGTTVVVESSAPKPRRGGGKKRRAPARRGGRGRRAVAAYNRAPRWKQRAMVGAAASAMGYVSKTNLEMYTKIPTAMGMPVELTIAVGAHFLSKGRPGLLDDVATAATAIAGYKLGRAEFDTAKITQYSVSGDDDYGLRGGYEDTELGADDYYEE
jgi:hypothetical protein